MNESAVTEREAPVDYRTDPSRYRHWKLTFDGPYATCSTTATGTGSVSGTSITGTYTGTTSCSSNSTLSSGQLTLNKQ